MCFLLMKMLGTVRWPEISARALWIAAPSSVVKLILVVDFKKKIHKHVSEI